MPFYDYYDDLAATGLGRAWAEGQAQMVLARIRAAHPSGRSVLEIGPGHGSFAAACRASGYSYTALDVNLRLLHTLYERGYMSARALAPYLPIRTARYDIAFASHVIEHNPNYREALAFLVELCRTVVPGGVVALVVPDYLALGDDFWHCDYSHGFVTTRRRMRQICRDAGLVSIDESYLWGPLQGASGWLAGLTIGGQLAGSIARRLPGRVGERLYKARLTFARAILVIGQVPA